jgi:hypothetical protein
LRDSLPKTRKKKNLGKQIFSRKRFKKGIRKQRVKTEEGLWTAEYVFNNLIDK